MRKQVKWTHKGKVNLADRFNLDGAEVLEEVRVKIEEQVNLGHTVEWVVPGKGRKVSVAISGMRFMCTQSSPGVYLILTVMTAKRFQKASRRWVKAGESGAVVERGKHLRSMPFGGLSKLLC